MTVQTTEPTTELEVATPTNGNLPAVQEPPQRKVTITPAEKHTVLPQTKVAKIAMAISSIMAEVGTVSKDGYNKFHQYKFVQMQDVLQKLTPLLAKHGIMIMQTEVRRDMFDDDRSIAVQYQFTIAHSSGEVWPERPLQTGLSRCRDSKGGFDDKALNKCHTAARKYFLMSLFQIPTGDQDDADLGHNDAPRRAPTPQRNVMSPPSYVGGHVGWTPPHDPETGEIEPAEAAADPAPPAPKATAASGEAGLMASEASYTLTDIDGKLGRAAEQGTEALKAAWNELTKDQQGVLQASLTRRHKPRAIEVDAMGRS